MRLIIWAATSVAFASYFVRQLSIPSLSVKTITAQHSPKKKIRLQMGNSILLNDKGLSHQNTCDIEIYDQERLTVVLDHYNILIYPCVPYHDPELKISLISSILNYLEEMQRDVTTVLKGLSSDVPRQTKYFEKNIYSSQSYSLQV
jgi:hypothetical protein